VRELVVTEERSIVGQRVIGARGVAYIWHQVDESNIRLIDRSSMNDNRTAGARDTHTPPGGHV